MNRMSDLNPAIEKYRAKAARLGLADRFVEEPQYYVSTQAPRRVRAVQGHAVIQRDDYPEAWRRAA